LKRGIKTHIRRGGLTGILAVLLIAVLTLVLAACGDQNKVTRQDPLVFLVTDTGSIGDSGFNDAGWSGCEQAGQDADIDIRCLESADTTELEHNLQSAGKDQAQTVIVMGGEHGEVLQRTSRNYPDSDFVIVGGNVYGSNTAAISFRDEQAGYLAGLAAASMTRTNVVGFVGGRRTSAARRCEIGYRAGVRTVRSDIKVVSGYTGSFSDSDAAQRQAESLYRSGADAIFHDAHSAGRGVIAAAGEKNFFVIGSDVDQSVCDSKHVLCSITRDISGSVAKEIERSVKGSFQAGTIERSVGDKGIGFSDNAGNLPDFVCDRLTEAEQQIRKERIVVPQTKKELQSFRAPELE
jgi:basic membrane protein A